ncbi:hypothetical protein RJ640_005450 [Escallonia rubra]|uniref:Uncharacterized protein n=1 Tax=Escallonia rubra TaxID=112253 RepID=A0AA88SBF4_9ASTE|nr:hypothetical protein RJ640_005450 [Escallonia rubra]
MATLLGLNGLRVNSVWDGLGKPKSLEANPHNKRTPNGEEKKEKRRTLAIEFTRKETEEDVFTMTGARPSRWPKKLPRTVQRQIGFYEFSLVISTVD